MRSRWDDLASHGAFIVCTLGASSGLAFLGTSPGSTGSGILLDHQATNGLENSF